MFREICFLREEHSAMELSPAVHRHLPTPTSEATARMTRGKERSSPDNSHTCETVKPDPGRKWATASNAAELLTDVTFLVYVSVHVAAVAALRYGASWRMAALCWGLYGVRMFGITAGYHRLLSHRSYRAGRWGVAALAGLGTLAAQRGPLWWASRHRHHHRTADTEEDVHSPLQWGFWWSHMGWFSCSASSSEVLWSSIPDLLLYPELRWLEKYHYVPPFVLGALLFVFGGVPAVLWGVALSTVLCWHATYCINSVAHLVGSRRFRCEFNTHCGARNNFWLALITLGEGWHNNHHCYMRSARHGFYSNEIDVTWYILLLLEKLGIVWDLELPPLKELEEKRFDNSHLQCRCKRVSQDLQETSSVTTS